MKKMSLLEMESKTGGLLDEGTGDLIDGIICGAGIGLLLTGGGSALGWTLAILGCARAFGL